MREKTMVVSME